MSEYILLFFAAIGVVSCLDYAKLLIVNQKNKGGW